MPFLLIEILKVKRLQQYYLTIGITYYNEKELLSRVLNSVSLAACRDNLCEVIIHDDCSTFPAKNFIPSPFQEVAKIIKGVKNSGPSYGRNRIIHASKGKFIRFIDADDEFGNLFFEQLFVAARDWEDDEAIYLNNSELIDTNGNQRYLNFNYISNLDLFRNAIINSWIPSNSVMFSKKLLINQAGFRVDLSQAEDVEFFYRISFFAKKIRLLEPKYSTIVHLRCLSHSSNFASNRGQLLQVINEKIVEHGPKPELILGKFSIATQVATRLDLKRGLIIAKELNEYKGLLIQLLGKSKFSMLLRVSNIPVGIFFIAAKNRLRIRSERNN